MTSEFKPMPKIPRFSREVIITEKLDGTNASIWIGEDGSIFPGSRNRFISVEQDNYGFARWVKEHEEELRQLGPGQHFGEWWGNGINRGYGLKEKRFSLFNVRRWSTLEKPACCGVVPVLMRGPADNLANMVELCLTTLRTAGSWAAPGFMQPEGIIIYHTAGGYLFKKTLEKDDQPKGAVHE